MFYSNGPVRVSYCLTEEEDFNNYWTDMNAAGRIYNHYGIEPDENGSKYNPGGVFYLK